jgi:hypothetical protein
MLDLLKEHASEIASFIAGLAGGSFLTLRFTHSQRAAGQATISDQRRARAGGDIVGRDKVTDSERRQPPAKDGK